jgi:hypothetical protein
MMWRRANLAWLLVLAASLTAGCGSQKQQELEAYRKQLLLSQAPAGVRSIADSKAQLADQPEVVLQGRVEADQVPGTEGPQAIFVLIELQPDDHGDQPGHVADNCPFCKRRAAKAPRATIQLMNAQGQVLPYSVQQLLGVQRGDIVVVQGRGQMVPELDLFTVTANGVYLKKP